MKKRQASRPVMVAASYLRDWTGFRVMYLVDAVVLFSTMVAITTVRFGFDWPTYSRTSYLTGFGVATGVHLIVAYFGGLYDRGHRLGNQTRMSRAGAVSVIAALIDATLSLGADQFLMPRLNLVVFTVAATFVLSFNRWLARRVLTARYGRPRVLLVGAPDDIRLAESHLAETDRDAHVVGRRSSVDDLADWVERLQASDVLLLSGANLRQIYPHPLGELEDRYVGVYHRLSPEDTLLGVQRTIQIAGMPFVGLRTHALPNSKAHFKRLLDLTYLLLGLPLILLVGLPILLWARIVAGSPIFYAQERIGRDGKPFVMLKLRTMYPDAEKHSGAVLAERDDVRVIPAMAWLRSTRLDELPQLWNVLRGDMSLVGPRPERPELAHQFEDLLPGYGRRHDIRPGLTGLAQIRSDYHTDPGYKLGHDLQYLVNWSPIGDLQILAKTIGVVLRRQS